MDTNSTTSAMTTIEAVDQLEILLKKAAVRGLEFSTYLGIHVHGKRVAVEMQFDSREAVEEWAAWADVPVVEQEPTQQLAEWQTATFMSQGLTVKVRHVELVDEAAVVGASA